MGYKDPERQREYQRKRVARRRAEWFADKSCVRCGSIENLELDHVDRTEKVTHAIWSWSQKRRDAELKKCQVLCSACHKEKTKQELSALFRQTHCRRGHPMEGDNIAMSGKYRRCRTCKNEGMQAIRERRKIS